MPGAPRRRGYGAQPKRAALVPLRVLSSEELETYDLDEKHAAALSLRLRGYTLNQLADHFQVSKKSIQNWLRAGRIEYGNRIQRSDEVLTEVMASIDEVILEAWRAHELADKDSLSAPNYLRLILDGAKEKARLLGLDQRSAEVHKGKTEVVVQIGGGEVKVGMRA